MSSNSSDSSPKSRKSSGEHSNDTVRALMLRINQLKKQIQSERSLSVKANVEENKERLETASRTDASTFENENNGLGKMLSSRIENPLCKVSGLIQESGERDCASGQEVVSVTTAKLPFVDKLPPYTTWIFLDRNQRMAEDQSVVGRRRIYYDQHGSEALICSDSEEENAETEEKKHDFSEGEDRILWMVSQEFGLSEKVLNILTQFIGGSTSEIQDRCSILEGKYTETEQNLKDFGEKGSERNLLLEKSLSTALDSFDNLFCRRCLVFDCRLHGCSQVLIDASEKQSYSPDNEARGKPCSDQCYLQLKASKDLHGDQATDLPGGSESKILEEPRSLVSLNTREQGEHTDSNLKRKALEPTYIIPENEKLVSDELQDSCNKKLKLSVPSVVSLPAECVSDINEPKVITDDVDESNKHSSESSCLLSISGDNTEANERIEEAATDGTPNRNPSSSFRRILGKGLLGISDWKPLEKELYLKGVEIFGRNRQVF
nr:histone-lysine N-methyltransferase EZA1 isoform X1 [Ipomoea batatas]GMD77081.1 histone-lysine N-methyltransferase EZA1 isoform X1 [Ipomoea batatas]